MFLGPVHHHFELVHIISKEGIPHTEESHSKFFKIK